MPLLPLAGRVWYLPGANNLGVIVAGDGGAIAVDTGIDKDAGRALRKALDEAGLELRAIISTHHHADHVGGNAFLLRQYPEARVYASPLEAALIQHPLLEPIYLSGGARPPAAMRGKWVLAPGSPVHELLGAAPLRPGDLWRTPVGATLTVDIVGLPGHSPAQVGVIVDGVCLAADGFFGPAVIAKHGVPYAHDVADQLAALDVLATLDAGWFLPGHGEPVGRADLDDQLAANRRAIEAATALVRAALAQPGDLAVITARVVRAMGHTLAGVPQYAIFSGAVAAHLAYLEQRGAARLDLGPDGLVWAAV